MPNSAVLRLALRRLARRPGYAAAVVLSLALGLAAATTMLGVVDALFFRPPAAVRDPGRVVDVAVTTYPDYEAVRDNIRQFSDVGAYNASPFPYTLVDGRSAAPVRALLASHTLWATLGARPALGRWPTADEDRPGGPRVVVLSHAFWRARYGGDPRVVGRAVRLAGEPYTVVGVAPPGFTGAVPDQVDLFAPIANTRWWGHPEALTNRDYQWLRVAARLRPGATAAQAEAAVTALYRRENVGVRAVDQDSLPRAVVRVRPVVATRRDWDKPELRVAVWLTGVAGLVLLVACANVAGLALARAVGERRELAVLAALGAGRARLVGRFVAESALLAAAGGTLGVVLARWGGAAVRERLLGPLAAGTPPVDGRVLALAALATLVALLLGGLLPALGSARRDAPAELRAGARAAAPHARVRALLVGAQVALALVLAVGAALFGTSLRRAEQADLGFTPTGLLVVDVDVRAAGVPPARAAAVVRDAARQLAALPGVAAVGATNSGLLGQFTFDADTPDGVPVRDSLTAVSAIDAGFARAAGLRLVAGRTFTEAEVDGDAPAALVSASFARARWPGRPALGRCVRLEARGGTDCLTVVGVVGDRRGDLRAAAPAREVYLPFGAGAHVPSGGRDFFVAGTFAVRPAAGAPAGVVAARVQQALVARLPGVPAVRVRPWEELLDPQLRAWRLGASLCVTFGAAAVALALFGVYATTAYSVARRGGELAVRAAVGARPGQLVSFILGDTARVAAAGVAAGLAAAAAARSLDALLYGVAPLAPAPYALAALGLLAAAIAAAFGPARRAARVDPAAALRAE